MCGYGEHVGLLLLEGVVVVFDVGWRLVVVGGGVEVVSDGDDYGDDVDSFCCVCYFHRWKMECYWY